MTDDGRNREDQEFDVYMDHLLLPILTGVDGKQRCQCDTCRAVRARIVRHPK